MPVIKINENNMEKLVEEAFARCESRRSENRSKAIVVEGVKANKYYFNSKRIEAERELVTMLVSKLTKKVEGGCTMMWLFRNNKGKSWTENIFVVDKLVAMAIALNLIEYCFSKEFWHQLPRGMPYLRIK